MSRIITPNQPEELRVGQMRAIPVDGSVVLQQAVIVQTVLPIEGVEGVIGILQQAMAQAKEQRAVIQQVVAGNGAAGP